MKSLVLIITFSSLACRGAETLDKCVKGIGQLEVEYSYSPSIQKNDIPPYQPVHFPSSELFGWQKGERDADIYARWAAREAEHAFVLHRQGVNFRAIITLLAVERGNLERELQAKGKGTIKPESIGLFTQRRQPNGNPQVASIGFATSRSRALRHAIEKSEFKYYLAPERLRLVQTAEAQGFPDKVLKKNRECPARICNYVTLEGRVINSGHLINFADEIIFEHPTHKEEVESLLDDASKRIELARTLQAPEAKVEQLALAMIAYYHAMPMERGSAAVGRSLFAGIAKDVLHKNVTLPADCDWESFVRLPNHAKSTEPIDYVEFMRAALLP